MCPDDDPLDTSGEFNDLLRLVEAKMVVDVTDNPKYADIRKSWGWCDIVLVHLSNRGQRMFERVSWEKWVN